MKKLFVLFLSLFSLTIFAQDQVIVQDLNAVTRPLNGSFTSISVSDGIDLYLTQSDNESVAVSASDNEYLSHFKTEVENGVLKLFYDQQDMRKRTKGRKNLKAYVSFKTLEKIFASAGASIVVKGAINTSSLKMKASSGAFFNGRIEAKSLVVEQSSGAEIKISGQTEKIKVDVSSGASFRGYDLAVDFCDAETSSGASIHITINKELNATAKSGGDIRYKGTALIRNITTKSGGSVKKS